MLEKIGKYEIRLQIGRGAMGVVYEGFDPVIGRRVAVKMLRTEMFEPRQLPDVLVRFKREAQSVGRLSHPHIVTIHEFGEEQGTPYIVMEYMSGTELGHRLESGSRFTLDEVVRIMTQLLGALTHAHEHGVVHRDLKPANMFLLDDGSLKVVDFGIARVEASDLTDTGAMLGTPAYMSPEQCLGLQVDHRSDLFSAGVILYQLLTGDKPFTGSVTTIIQKVLRQDPIAPSELNPTLSPAWDKVVARAMAKKPEARFESARQFAEAIKAAFTADRAHEDEGRRRAAEAEEHANRAAEERSRAESLRRAEDERREAERRAHAETEARRAAEARARHEAEERTVLMEKPARSRAPAIALAILVVLGIAGGLLYYRQGVEEQASRAEAARVAAEARVREETGKRTKAEALARDESERRAKLEAETAKKEAEAKREAELAAKARAEEEAKKAAEEKRKALALKKEEEEKKKADAAKKAEEARRAAPRAGAAFRDCEACPEMVTIPAGNFLMGSPDSEQGRDNDEGPQHQVSISRTFAAGKYEVTFDEWDACVRESGCTHNPSDSGWGRGGRPVINVSWQDARQYAEWLSRKTGKRYRLLTEAEWEYAARAGTQTAYSTGATIAASQANYGGSRKQTAPVGSYGPNAFGLHDVHGNVWEWTEDCWNANYNGAPTNGSAWLSGDCSQRVFRGGSWDLNPRSLRSANRNWSASDIRGGFLGIRLARTLEESDKRAKAETLAREEADKRPKLGADAAKKEAERAAKKEAEDNAKSEAAKKTEEARQAARKPGSVFQDCADCPRMVVIPAGEFTMGSPASEAGRDNNEGPQHRVSIANPFALGRNEVTVAEFRRFADEAAYKTDAERNLGNAGCFGFDREDPNAKKRDWHANWSWRNPGFQQADDHPVACVSWNDARAYAQWLSKKTARRYRLPTEAEWEYAARAGTATAHFWGDDPNAGCRYGNLPDRARYKNWNFENRHECDDGYFFTSPSGSFTANKFGLYDMLGNVWERTEDCWNASYAGAPSDGTAWLTGDCSRRGVRGASWVSSPRFLRSASRAGVPTGFRNHNSGFRLARTLE